MPRYSWTWKLLWCLKTSELFKLKNTWWKLPNLGRKSDFNFRMIPSSLLCTKAYHWDAPKSTKSTSIPSGFGIPKHQCWCQQSLESWRDMLDSLWEVPMAQNNWPAQIDNCKTKHGQICGSLSTLILSHCKIAWPRKEEKGHLNCRIMITLFLKYLDLSNLRKCCFH